MIKIYHNPRCSKSRDGLKIVEASKQPFQIIKYLKEIPSKQELKNIIAYLNISPEQLIRKNEKIWKEKFKTLTLSNDEIIDAMLTYPNLIERPIVIKDKKGGIGRPPENITDFLAL